MFACRLGEHFYFFFLVPTSGFFFSSLRLLLRFEFNLWNGSTTFILPRVLNMTSWGRKKHSHIQTHTLTSKVWNKNIASSKKKHKDYGFSPSFRHKKKEKNENYAVNVESKGKRRGRKKTKVLKVLNGRMSRNVLR